MLLAELEIWHSRPITPTRRVALGHLVLPSDPTPGFGGVLLGAVIARHLFEVDDDLHPDIQRLILEVQRGDRVVQPRLRHRFQVDRHGLSRSVHRLVGEDDAAEFVFGTNGNPLQQVLGAIYALERLEPATRRTLGPVLVRSMSWRGPIGASFISYLVGNATNSVSALADPRAWALEVLGFPAGTIKPSKREITQRFREKLRLVHPDHGGSEDRASREIADLAEARRVLTKL
ncbi:MAG: J domain-containing protein [Actinobacteria bacterium]|nr:J domain-containing protein [Actinomycetota bacterium]